MKPKAAANLTFAAALYSQASSIVVILSAASRSSTTIV
jgi:hypothetical protein